MQRSERRNFLCPITAALCTHGECLHSYCIQQIRNDWLGPSFIGALSQNLTRRKIEEAGWQLTHRTGKHSHFRHPTRPGIITAPTDDKLLGTPNPKRAKPLKVEAVMQYLMIVWPRKDCEYFRISFPDFPGCLTAARTLNEVRKTAGEALRGHIETMHAAGLPIPVPSTLGALMQHPDYADSPAMRLAFVRAQKGLLVSSAQQA